MSGRSLKRRVRHGIKVVVAVMNNGVLGYQKHAEDAGLGRHTNVCDFVPVDHAAIAEACGVKGIRLERPAGYCLSYSRSYGG